MLFEYISLGILLIGLSLVFYTFIYIHDIPYEQAKKRNHPQAHAIHTACWLSLFTLHAIWPLVFLWAVAKPLPLRVKVVEGDDDGNGIGAGSDAANARIADLEARLLKLETEVKKNAGGAV